MHKKEHSANYSRSAMRESTESEVSIVGSDRMPGCAKVNFCTAPNRKFLH